MMGANNLHHNVNVTAVAQRYLQVVQDIRQHQVEPIILKTAVAFLKVT
jgi:hypothetical protein